MDKNLREFFYRNLARLEISDNNLERLKNQWDRFSIFLQELRDWNKRINLTSIDNEKDIIIKHFIDSLTLLVLEEIRGLGKGSRVIDIGAGAGFPGIPLKIALPDIDISLLESSRKRVGFLRNLVNRLSLSNVEIVCGRAEEYGREEGVRETFDVVVSRAVGEMRVLGELSLPFLKRQGIFVAMKGPSYNKELNEAEEFIGVLGGKIDGEIISIELIDSSGEPLKRNLVKVRKIGLTPEKYPRQPGIPQKKRG